MPQDKDVAILTTARSDFGPLRKVIQHAAQEWRVHLLVAGSHFLDSRGYTYVDVTTEFSSHPHINIVPIDVMTEEHTAAAQIQLIADTQRLISKWFDNNNCDLLIFLGDRWELWGITIPAFLYGIPMGHISGGEITEGVIDDAVRHSHTKIASLHFVAAREYASNISLMGEEDWRISVVGEVGLDSIHESRMSSYEDVKRLFGIDLSKPTILATFHPSTLDFQISISRQIEVVLNGLKRVDNHQVVITAPGAEQGSDIVLNAIKDFADIHDNVHFVEHLGSSNYLAVLKASRVVVGNSSSGITEAPSCGIPTVNIGNRQKNRISADSVLHVGYDADGIYTAINKAIDPSFQKFSKKCKNPYDPHCDGRNSWRVTQSIRSTLDNFTREELLIKKYDNQEKPDLWGFSTVGIK